jgi:hypothetical protein
MNTVQTKVISIFIAIVIIVLSGLAIYTQINEYYSQQDHKLYEIWDTIRPICHKDKFHTGELSVLNDRDILGEITFHKGNKSYTINKQKVYLCLKNENDEYYNMNMLIYVTLHELAHVICDEIGHTEKFQRIFDELIIEATNEGIYNPSIPIIKNYCQYND